MKNFLVSVFGYIATVLHGDAAVFDRWLWLKKHITRGPVRTLDAGCGTGAFAMYAAKVGNDVTGISFHKRENETAYIRANILRIKNVKFITGDLKELDRMFDGLGVFDQIICLETIEHILGDRKLLKDFSGLLKPGGKLLLTAPYKNYRRMPGDKLSSVEDGGHVRWGYTHEEMEEMLKEAGFEVEYEGYVTGFISQMLIRFERLFVPINHYLAWLIVLPFRVLRVFDPLLMKFISYPYLSIGIVARKI